MTNFDALLENIGPFGRYQIYHYALIGLTGFCPGWFNLANVFLVGLPDYWCHVPEMSSYNLSVDEMKSLAPYDEKTITHCERYDLNYTEVIMRWERNESLVRTNASSLVSCTQWDYDYGLFGRTLVTEYNLVCGRGWMRAMASSIYMLGFLLGCIVFGFMADKVGRKPTWMLCLCLAVVFSTLSVVMPEYWSHVFTRLVVSMAAAGAFTSGFVIVTEIIGVDQRLAPSIMYQAFFAGGYFLLAGMASLIRDFVWLNLCISLIPILFLPMWWVIGESPRWLFARGQADAARQEVQRAASVNGTLTDDLLEQAEALSKKAVCELGQGPAENYSILDLLRMRVMRARTLITWIIWFTNSMVFYGLTLGVADLAGSPYINLAISACMEIPGLLIAVLTLNRAGRRWPLALLMVGGGVFCLLVAALPKEGGLSILRTTLAMLGKLAIAGSFAVIYLFSAEIFPTVVRTIAVGSGSMSARAGGLVAPFVADLGNLVWGPLPFLIFGITSVVAGLMSLLLPETLHQKLPETLQEGERFNGAPTTNPLALCRRRNANRSNGHTMDAAANVKKPECV